MRIKATLILCGLVLSACPGCRRPGPSTDFDELCHAPERTGVGESTEIVERSLKLARYAQLHVKTEEGRQFMVSMANMPDGMKAARLREKAAQYGVKDCPMADLWQKASDAHR